MLLDRLLAKCEDHLSLLAAPATLDNSYDFGEGDFDHLLEIVQANVPTVVLDVPHLWTSWARKTLVAADEVIITAQGDTADFVSRMFAPRIGIPEDPVSGNAHGMLGVYLVTHGLLAPTSGKVTFRGHQGHAVRRPGPCPGTCGRRSHPAR